MQNENNNVLGTSADLKSVIEDSYISQYKSTDSQMNMGQSKKVSVVSKSSTVSTGSFQLGQFLTESAITHEMETYFKEREKVDITNDNPRKPLLREFEDIDNDVEEPFYEFSESDCSIVDQTECEYQRGAGWPSGILIMANVCLGMGILNFPRIFYEAGGILITLLCLAIFVCLIAGSLYIIAYCCRYYACVNFQDMVRVHCGWQFGMVCSVALFFELTGSLIVKMVVLGDQLDRLYSIIADEPHVKHYYLMPIVAFIVVLPMCFIKDFSCFKYLSVGGVLAALYITFGVAVIGYYSTERIGSIAFKETKEEPKDFNLLLPLLVYGYHGHVEAPLVFSGLRKQKLHNFMKTVYSYLFISTVCYSITGVFGYLTFGRLTNVDFMLNYPQNNWFANAGIIIISFKLFTSFPVLFFVVRSVFAGFYSRVVNGLPNRPKSFLEDYSVARSLQTIIIFSFVVLFAVVIPNISNAISLIGSISCHFCFTFPGLCFFCLYFDAKYSNRKQFIRKIGGIFYIILGMFCFGVNLTVAIQSFISGKSSV